MTLTIEQKNSIAERYKQSFGLDDILEVDDQRTGVKVEYDRCCYGTRAGQLLRIRTNRDGRYVEEEITQHPGRETASLVGGIIGSLATMNGLTYLASTVNDRPGFFYMCAAASALFVALATPLFVREALYETRIWKRFQEKKESPNLRYYPCI